MRSPRRPLLIVLCLSLAVPVGLAGCLGSGGPEAAPRAEDVGAADDTTVNPGSGLPARNAPVAKAPAPQRELVAVPFAYDGTTQGGACVRGPNVSECRYAVAGSAITPLTGDGDPRRLNATLTWSSPTPATETLRASLAIQYGDSWFVYDYPGWSFAGKSPLSVEWSLAGAPAGLTWGIAVTTRDPFSAMPEPVPPAPGLPVPASGSVDVPQSYRVTGELFVLAPP